jgi:RNA polymerase sigma-70 factor (ECF subfamily)
MTEVDVAALRAGDEMAFRTLVNDVHSTLIRLAMMYSPNRATAEEAVQETWIAVLSGLDGFAGRASLRTWICRILVRTAQRRAGQEARSTPFSVIDDEAGFVSVSPDAFVQSGPRAGRWIAVPDNWARVPEDKVLSGELQAVVHRAIGELPQVQREVITLRDVEGWTSAEVSDLLDISDGNQRVLLHRARAKVRLALDAYLQPQVAA